MNTIIELYTKYPKLPLASAFISTLDTNTLLALKSDAEHTIKNFSLMSSILNMPFEIYCCDIYKSIKKLLKQRAKEEKTLNRAPRRRR